jgi:hypothetical protein
VRLSRGVCAVTVTVKVQERVVATASVAVHCTGVEPMGKGDPEARSHVICTGGTPPVAVGDGYVTDTAAPVNEVVVTFAGHVIVSGGPDGTVVVVVGGTVVVVVVVVVVGLGVGELGLEHDAAATRAKLSNTGRKREISPFFKAKSESRTHS